MLTAQSLVALQIWQLVSIAETQVLIEDVRFIMKHALDLNGTHRLNVEVHCAVHDQEAGPAGDTLPERPVEQTFNVCWSTFKAMCLECKT